MTVAELIAELSKLDPDMPVYTYDPEIAVMNEVRMIEVVTPDEVSYYNSLTDKEYFVVL
jgi:hypothetical protein